LQNGEIDLDILLTSAAKNVTLTVRIHRAIGVDRQPGDDISDNSFTWDGTRTDGTKLGDGGQYTLSVTATDSSGASVYDLHDVSGTRHRRFFEPAR